MSMMVVVVTGEVVGVRRISGIELGAICNHYVIGHVTQYHLHRNGPVTNSNRLCNFLPVLYVISALRVCNFTTHESLTHLLYFVLIIRVDSLLTE